MEKRKQDDLTKVARAVLKMVKNSGSTTKSESQLCYYGLLLSYLSSFCVSFSTNNSTQFM